MMPKSEALEWADWLGTTASRSLFEFRKTGDLEYLQVARDNTEALLGLIDSIKDKA